MPGKFEVKDKVISLSKTNKDEIGEIVRIDHQNSASALPTQYFVKWRSGGKPSPRTRYEIKKYTLIQVNILKLIFFCTN